MRTEYRDEKDCLSLKGARISADSAAGLCTVLAGQALYMYCKVIKQELALFPMRKWKHRKVIVFA